ncbi:MAG: helix-turn-helix domain-containing protein [Planctomycetes bacterium]|nr:helix-turn-helix domain-containing protein [Planctomycetota bacterium]
MDSTVADIERDLQELGVPALAGVKQLAKLLGISRDSLYQAIRSGKLRAFRNGSFTASLRIRRADAARWIAAHPAN